MTRDVAIISFASVLTEDVQDTETQMLFPVITQAIADAGVDRKSIGFTVSGSCDYLAGAPFAFVQNLEATGAWPPISESHVEMDGAWALYEAFVRLQHGDVDVALVFSSGISSRGDLRETLCIQLDPYYLAPLWPDNISLAALQARAALDAGRTEADFAQVAARTAGRDVDALLSEPYVVAPLRAHDCAPARDGAAAVILAVGDRARELSERPVWITGIDHRSDAHYLGVRDLATSASARIAGEQAGVDKGPVDVAELHALFSSQELILRDALGLADTVEVNPSGGSLAGDAFMASGLIRIGEAFQAVSQRGAARAVAHATSGPCLQQNLVCVLEGGD